MHLKQLEGTPTSRGALHVVEVRPAFREELDVAIALGDSSPSVWVKYFAGRPSAYIPPWIEANFRVMTNASPRTSWSRWRRETGPWARSRRAERRGA